LQEDIVLDVLGGKDVFAVLPTGGGKSVVVKGLKASRTMLPTFGALKVSPRNEGLDAHAGASSSAGFSGAR
jgi:superfamily II DNA or RNA helicase